jgi:hypothetical protein
MATSLVHVIGRSITNSGYVISTRIHLYELVVDPDDMDHTQMGTKFDIRLRMIHDYIPDLTRDVSLDLILFTLIPVDDASRTLHQRLMELILAELFTQSPTQYSVDALM